MLQVDVKAAEEKFFPNNWYQSIIRNPIESGVMSDNYLDFANNSS